MDGGLDVAAGTPAAGLFNGISRGMNLKVVAGLSRMGGPDDCSFITFEVRKDLFESGEVTSVADWAGHKVGINGIGAMPHFQLATLLEKEGLTMDDIELVTLPFPELVAGLQSKALDVIFTLEPLLSQVRANDLGVTQVYLNDSFPYQTSVFLMYGPNLLDKDPELGERFMVAFLKVSGRPWKARPKIISNILKPKQNSPLKCLKRPAGITGLRMQLSTSKI